MPGLIALGVAGGLLAGVCLCWFFCLQCVGGQAAAHNNSRRRDRGFPRQPPPPPRTKPVQVRPAVPHATSSVSSASSNSERSCGIDEREADTPGAKLGMGLASA